jgi:hypothetical protein
MRENFQRLCPGFTNIKRRNEPMQTVILLGLVSLLTDISSEMVYPLLSLYLTTTLGATPAIIGVIEGI